MALPSRPLLILWIIATEFPNLSPPRPRDERAPLFVAVAGGSLGLLAGGVLTQTLSWHWIFFVNLPIGAMTIALGRALIPTQRAQSRARPHRLAGVAPGHSLADELDLRDRSGERAQLGLEPDACLRCSRGRADGRLWPLEARIDNPILPLRILRVPRPGRFEHRSRLSCHRHGTYLSSSARCTRSTCSATARWQTGLAFLPWTLTVAALSLGITARLVERFGAMRVLIAGMLTVLVGLGLLTTVGPHTSFFPTIFLGYFTIGLGIGSAFMPLLTIAMANVPAADAGLGSGIINVSQQVSGALGLALLGTIATNRTHDALELDHHWLVGSLIGGYHLAFAVGASRGRSSSGSSPHSPCCGRPNRANPTSPSSVEPGARPGAGGQLQRQAA